MEPKRKNPRKRHLLLPPPTLLPKPLSTGDKDAPLKSLKSIEFGIMSPEEIESLSVIPTSEGITSAHLLLETEGNVLDPRLGPTGMKGKCGTCQLSLDSQIGETCPGHYGHIRLAEPVFNPCFMKKILALLKSICVHCYQLKLPLGHKKLMNVPRRFKAITDVCTKERACYKSLRSEDNNPCAGRQPAYSQRGLAVFRTENDGSKTLVTPDEVMLRFVRIPDNECRRLGIDPTRARPEWMIITVLPVLPLTARPTSFFAGDILIHETSKKYRLIVEKNQQLKGATNLSDTVQNMHSRELQQLVADVICGKTGKERETDKGSLKDRLCGKTGRIRGNLMGKRVDYSGRSVITPDPNISVDEAGVPLFMAQVLRIPEKVTPMNIDRLQALVYREVAKDGTRPVVYPAARGVIKSNGRKVLCNLLRNPKEIPLCRLTPGDQVERDLMNGDTVFLNRQPSLHKMSAMGHKVRVLPGLTLRLNLSATTPYNADFDGDEMAIHVPQSIDAIAEVNSVMSLSSQIVTPQSNQPIIAVVQDALVAAYALTSKDTFLKKPQFMDAMMYLTDFPGKVPKPCILRPVELWSGKQLFSTTIPEKHNQFMNTASAEDQLNDILHVWKGQLLSGRIMKSTLGTSSASLVHTVWLDHGKNVAKTFVDDVQNVCKHWFYRQGFSVGHKDSILPDEAVDSINSTVKQSKKTTEKLAKKGASEAEINKRLNDLQNVVGNMVLDECKQDNRFRTMFEAGSKGTVTNIAQITSCVGQINIKGQRIPAESFGGRALPSFLAKHSNKPECRGFVTNSLIKGLTPEEMFFTGMAGREGLIDTGMKTSEIGYMSRKMVKTMESVKVCLDETVRDGSGNVVDFQYGEDGMTGEKLERQPIEALSMPIEEFEKLYRFTSDMLEDAKAKSTFIQQVCSSLETEDVCRDNKDAVQEEWTTLRNCRLELQKDWMHGNIECRLPLNFDRLFAQVKQTYHIAQYDTQGKHKSRSDFLPMDCITEVERLMAKLFEPVVIYTVMEFVFRTNLSCKMVIGTHRLNFEAFKALLETVERKFYEAKAPAGEMVGVLAAQSIGEPATQMTLNTFHFAGISQRNVTLGLPRLRELVEVSKNPKNPKTVCFMSPKFSGDLTKAKSFETKLKDKGYHVVLREAATEDYVHLRSYLKPKTREWLLEVYGTTIAEMVAYGDVDPKRIVSNNIWDVLNVLGIEAARRVLLIELRKLLDAYDLKVDPRHLMVLCASLTSTGSLLPATRYGVIKKNESPFMRCSFEQTADVLMDAASLTETDKLFGVSEQQIFGIVPSIGGGLCNTMLDLNVMQPKEPLVTLPEKLYPAERLLHRPAQSEKLATDPYETPANFAPPQVGYAPELLTPAESLLSSSPGLLSGPKSPSYSPTPATGSTSPSYNPPPPSYSPLSPEYSPTPATISYSPGSPTYTPEPLIYASSLSECSPPLVPKYARISPLYASVSPKLQNTAYSPFKNSGSPSPTSPTYSPMPAGFDSPTSAFTIAAAPSTANCFGYLATRKSIAPAFCRSATTNLNESFKNCQDLLGQPSANVFESMDVDDEQPQTVSVPEQSVFDVGDIADSRLNDPSHSPFSINSNSTASRYDPKKK